MNLKLGGTVWSARKLSTLFIVLMSISCLIPPKLAMGAQGSTKKPKGKQRKAQLTPLTHIPPIDVRDGSFKIASNQPLDQDTAGSASPDRPFRLKHRSADMPVRCLRVSKGDGTFTPLKFSPGHSVIDFYDTQAPCEQATPPPPIIRIFGKTFVVTAFKIEAKQPLDIDTGGTGSTDRPFGYKYRDSISIGCVIVKDNNTEKLKQKYEPQKCWIEIHADSRACDPHR